ncbi:hypothetical protein MAHJHV33_08400 [Mycobacterium avium subsp. hominissuis]
MQLRLAESVARSGCRSKDVDQADVELEGSAAPNTPGQVLEGGLDEFLDFLLGPLVVDMVRPVVASGPGILGEPGEERREHLTRGDAVGQRPHQQPYHGSGIRFLALLTHGREHLLAIGPK